MEISIVVPVRVPFGIMEMLITEEHDGLLCACEEHCIYFHSIFMLFLINIHLFHQSYI